MVYRKSPIDMEFYVNLLRNVLADAYACYPEIPSYEIDRDFVTISSRLMDEGLSFATKTLPMLGKALDRALETGQLIVPPAFSRKSKRGVRWNIPNLFSELFLTIFDHQGHLVHDTNTAVGMIRQLCFVCYKVECPLDDKQAKASLSSFKDLDLALGVLDAQGGFDRGVLRHARYLLSKVFRGFDPSDITPRHGPGAVADRSRGREKYDVSFFSHEIDRLYPYVAFATFSIHTQTLDDLMEHTHLPTEKPSARVVCVPKDSRGPRIISSEPALLQYLQQGLSRKIVCHLQDHRLTRGRVLFDDQTTHRALALRSSKDGRFATLDMSDASDRVSNWLVKSLFPERLLPYLFALRSETTTLPDGETIRLNKYAPMGSALCFPIEALCFWALSCAAVRSVSRGRSKQWKDIYVFGDDIIAPTQMSDHIIRLLEPFGLKFNRDKCFMRGKFRESCGCDAFNSEDVTPVRIRVLRTLARNRSFVDVYRMSKNAMAFFDKGYWRASDYIWRLCESIVGKIPTTSPRFAGVSRASTVIPCGFPLPMGGKTRWNTDLQRMEFRSFTLRSRSTYSPFSKDVFRLGHNLLQGMPEPYDDYVAVPHSALPKAGWFAAL